MESDVIPKSKWEDDMRKWPNIMYGDIFNYIVLSKSVDGNDMKNYKSLLSYNYFQSGCVDQVLFRKVDDHVQLQAQVRPSQSINKCPNEATVTCEPNGTILSATCTCMAGKGQSCSHVGAVMWKVEHAVRNNMTGVSCTDETALWNRGTKRNVEPRPLSMISFKKPKQGADIIEDDDLEIPDVRDTPFYISHDEFVDSVTKSELAPLFQIRGTVLNKSYSCTPKQISCPIQGHTEHISISSCNYCSTFYSKYVNLVDSKVDMLRNATTAQSDTLWKDSRRLRITASVAHKIPVKDTTDPQNFLREHMYPKFIGNKYTKHGIENEKLAKQFLTASGTNIRESGLCICPNEPWLAASPDGLLDDATLLEIKSPVHSNLRELFTSGKYDVISANNNFELKEKGIRGYYMQVQLTMFCTGCKKCKLLVWYNENDHFFVDVLFNDDYVHNLVCRLKTFYYTHMLPRLADDVDEGRLVLSKAFRVFIDQQ